MRRHKYNVFCDLQEGFDRAAAWYLFRATDMTGAICAERAACIMGYGAAKRSGMQHRACCWQRIKEPSKVLYLVESHESANLDGREL